MSLNHETMDNIARVALIGGSSTGTTVGTIGLLGWIETEAAALGVILTGTMAAIALIGLMVTWYFKNEENRRKNEIHRLQTASFTDKIEGTDNDGIS